MDLDELIPREDISPKMTDALMGQLTSANWKDRKVGMEAVEAVLTRAGASQTSLSLSLSHAHC